MDYIITSHKGAGKTKLAVSQAVEGYLRKGKRVASNVTIHLDQAMSPDSRATYIKLPYIPAKEHLESLGLGYPELNPLDPRTYDEDKFGLVILDEAGAWMNAREWNDKERKGLFEWLTHARKYGWDVFTIVQDFEALDAQIRRSICECHVHCSRLDRVKVPYLPLRLPKIFRATARYGGPNGQVYKRWHATDEADRWYSTGESIRREVMYTNDGQVLDMRAPWSHLSAWHLVGRYLPPRRPRWHLLGVLASYGFVALVRCMVPPGRSSGGTSLGESLRNDLALIFPRMFPDRAKRLQEASTGKPGARGRLVAHSHMAYRFRALVEGRL